MAVFDPKVICRLCAKEKEFCVDVFGEDGVKNNLSKKIRLCLPITVREDDEYPKQICLSCLNKLDTSYELYSGCLSAEHIIKKLMRYCTRLEPPVDVSSIEIPAEDIESDTNCIAQQTPQPVLSQSNPVMKIGGTVATLIDKTRKRKSNERALESEPKVRSIQNDQYDNLNIKVYSDDSITVGSPLQSPLLSNGDGDDDDDDDDDDNNNDNDNDECSHALQQGSQLHLPPDNLSSYTEAPSSQMCLAGNVSTAPSLQQLQTSGKVSTAPSHGQLLGSIPANRVTMFSGMVQSKSDVGNQMESNSATSNLVTTSSGLSGTSKQYDNFSSVSDSAVMLRVQQPSSEAVRQQQVYLSGCVYNSSIVEQEGSTSGSLVLVKALDSTLSPSSHTVVPGNVSTALSSLQLDTSGKVSEALSCDQLVGSIPTSRESKFLGMVQTSSSVGAQREYNSSTSNVVMKSSVLSGTSDQYDNFSSLSVSGVTLVAQQPTADKVRQQQVYIPCSVYNTVCQEDGLRSGSLTHVNTLQDTVAPSSHTNVPGNVSKARSSQQLHISGKVSKAPSGGQFVDSIPNSTKRNFLGTVEPASNVGIPAESSSSASGLVLAVSGLSGTLSQYENLSSSVNSVVPVMVQQVASHTVQQPLQKSSVNNAFSSDKRRLKGPSNALLTPANHLVVPQQQKMASLLNPHASKRKVDTTETTWAHLTAAEAGNILAVSPKVEASSNQFYIPNGAQDGTSLGGNHQAVILESQHLYSSGNHVEDQGVSSDTATAITSPVIAAICPTSAMAGATVATVATTAGAVSLGATPTVTSFIPNVVLMGTGVCAAYPTGAASVTDIQGPAVTGIGSGSPISASTTSVVTTRASSNIAVVTPVLTKRAEISDSDSTNQTGLPSAVLTVQEQVSEESSSSTGAGPGTTINSVTTTSTSSPVHTVAVIETGNKRVTEEKKSHVCPYCQKTFPESIILHHKKLHYRKPFYSCLSCGKNFRTVLGLENHRCTSTAE